MATRRLWIFLVPAPITLAFTINLCSAVYRCGCRSLWAGAAEHCNIHTAGARHCPWCTFDSAVTLPLVLILGLQLALSLGPKRWPWGVRLTLALLAFPALGTLAALIAGWLTGYWTGPAAH